jgi:hypothetical protein
MDNNKHLTTPVLLLAFNRPNCTQKIFDAIREAKPENLYIAVDGPRKHNTEDLSLCKKVRSIATQVDWPCNLSTLIQEENLGCRMGVYKAISWFFENEEAGIILEDDCLPDISFFYFCQDTLYKYKSYPEIGIICGSYYHFDKYHHKTSIYFTINPYIWGWATWKRVWKDFDQNMPDFNLDKGKSIVEEYYLSPAAKKYWLSSFKNTANRKINSWGYAFTWYLLTNSYLNISPVLNLISNIGFGESGTHTKGDDHIYANMPRKEITFPLTYPSSIIRNKDLDLAFEEAAFRKINLLKRFQRKMKRIIKSI